jgi:hypothetical protein
VATQKGVVTSQELRSSGHKFQVIDSPPPCLQDRWSGQWNCGHDHSPSVPLQDAYQYFEGWTTQEQS